MNAICTASDVWFLHDTSVLSPRLQIVCIPYAGGGASAFHSWKGTLGPKVRVCIVQLPGREARINERPFHEMDTLVENLGKALVPHIDIPYVLFGHSNGALISFEVAHWMKINGHRLPLAIAASGSRAPDRPNPEPPIGQLPDREFIERVADMQGIPIELMEQKEVLDLLLPALRADFIISDTYRSLPRDPLDCSIYAYGGLNDLDISREDLEAWRHHTTGKFKLRMLPGNHFFLRSARTSLLQYLSDDIRECMTDLD